MLSNCSWVIYLKYLMVFCSCKFNTGLEKEEEEKGNGWREEGESEGEGEVRRKLFPWLVERDGCGGLVISGGLQRLAPLTSTVLTFSLPWTLHKREKSKFAITKTILKMEKIMCHAFSRLFLKFFVQKNHVCGLYSAFHSGAQGGICSFPTSYDVPQHS